VRQGVIQDGGIVLNFFNGLPVAAVVTVSMDDFTAGGQPLAAAYNVQSGAVLDQQFIDLSGYMLDVSSQDVEVLVQMDLEDSGEQLHDMISSDFVEVELSAQQLLFSTVTASLNIIEEFPAIEEEVLEDAPIELSGLAFLDALFTLTFQNYPFTVRPNITISVSKEDITQSLVVDEVLPANTVSSIVLDKNGVNSTPPATGVTIVDLLNTVPERFTVTGTLQITGDAVTVQRGNDYNIDYVFDLPLEYQLESSVYDDVHDLTIDDDARDIIADNLVNIELSGEIYNQSAFSGTLSAYVGVVSTSVDALLFQAQIPEPAIDANGNILSPGIGAIGPIALSKSQLDVLKDAHFLRVEAVLDSRDAAKVQQSNIIILRDVYLSGTGLIDTEE
jgi:hypothetical protein